MSDPRVLVRAPRSGAPSRRPSIEAAWRGLGWFGLLLASAGLSDLVLLWTPVRLGSPEWEFATITATMSALPLVTIGLAGILGALAFGGRRWGLRLMGALLLIAALAVVGMLVLFLTTLPMAVRATAEAGDARLGITRASIKTAVLAVLFGTAYFAAAVWSLRLSATTAKGG